MPINLQSISLNDQLRWLYKNHPDDLALVLMIQGEERHYTYASLFEHAAHYAQTLKAAGIHPGDLVALVLQHGESVIFGFWGALMLGAIPSIFPFLTEKLDRDRYFENMRALIQHAQVRVVITYSDLMEPLEDTLAGLDTLNKVINADELAFEGDTLALLETVNPIGEDTAFLQHSSGSTGLQKGVMLSHASVLNHIRSYSETIGLTQSDVIVSWLPLYHDMGLIAGFVMPILSGCKLVLMSPFQWIRDPKILLQAIHRHQGTLTWLPNFAYNFLAIRVQDDQIKGLDLSSLRAVINTAEPIYAESHASFLDKYMPYNLNPAALATSYGMAENTFAATQSIIGQEPNVDRIDRIALMENRQAVPCDEQTQSQTFVSCGHPIPGCTIKIIDSEGTTLPERQVGEIVLRSTSMLSGYYRQPKLSAEALRDGWYLTGDMGYIANGELYVTGRKKDLIIVGGKNIYPQDIENLLNDIPGLYPGRASAFGVYNAQLGTEDVAIVAEIDSRKVNPDDNDALNDIVRIVRTRVARNMDVAARFVKLVDNKWLIKTSSGKVARRANREKFLQETLPS